MTEVIRERLTAAIKLHPEHAEEYKDAMARNEHSHRGDEVAEFPFVVVYRDRAVWPASDYFKTRAEADEAVKARPAQNIQERRWNADGVAESRLLWGKHPDMANGRPWGR